MALTLLATNNAESTLASAISATDTSLIVSAGTGAEFPDAVAGESYFKLTLTDATTGSQVEIVNVTAKAGDIFTIERAQEGTLARAWAANDMVANMMTADTLNVIAQYMQQAGDSAQQAAESAFQAAESAEHAAAPTVETMGFLTAGMLGIYPSDTLIQTVKLTQLFSSDGLLEITEPGVYLTDDTLYLRDNTSLYLAPGVTLKQAGGANKNVISNTLADAPETPCDGALSYALTQLTEGYHCLITVPLTNHGFSVGDAISIRGQPISAGTEPTLFFRWWMQIVLSFRGTLCLMTSTQLEPLRWRKLIKISLSMARGQ